MTQYYLAYDDGNMVIRNRPNAILEKFDTTSKKWVSDVNLGRIYFGDMPVKVLTAEEARKITGEN
jgi:hypothetical protein